MQLSNISTFGNTYTGIAGLVVAFVAIVLLTIFSFVCQKCSLITTLIEGVAGSSLAVCYIVCAGALTFKDGPATYIGSQYLSAWAGFFLGCSMVSSVLKESLVNRSRVSESEAVQTSAPKTQPNPQQECHVSIPIEAEISV